MRNCNNYFGIFLFDPRLETENRGSKPKVCVFVPDLLFDQRQRQSDISVEKTKRLFSIQPFSVILLKNGISSMGRLSTGIPVLILLALRMAFLQHLIRCGH
jgi:hypothetical protein